jgi:parallel beta-helix repeat protein
VTCHPAATQRFRFAFSILLLTSFSAPTVWGQCPGNPVTVKPSDDLDALVRACPSGTAFNLTAGVHHDSVTSLKNDDVFTGASDAIESGARTLTGWKQVTVHSGTYWTTAAGAPLPSDPQYAVHCQTNYPRCWYMQDLYFDDADYVHVPSLDRLQHGTWYYDLDGSDGGVKNNIYLSEDPNGHAVELGAQKFAFTSVNASGVTIRNLIIEKYAQNLQDGAVLVRAPGWTIEHCEIRLNHGAGVSARPPNGSDAKIVDNALHDNGQYGFNVGKVFNVTVSRNRVYHNNIDHVSTNFGSGGSKVAGTNLTVSNNTVYDNLGMGLWSDAFANGVTFDSNTVYGNTGDGIRVEVSDHNTITNNAVHDNGFGNPDEGNRKSPQVHYVSSSHATIKGNIIVANGNSAGALVVDYNSKREGCGRDCKVPQEMNISGNRITVQSPNTPAIQFADYSNTFEQWAAAVVFDENIYCLPSSGGQHFRFGNGNPPAPIAFKDWQKKGLDEHGAANSGDCAGR